MTKINNTNLHDKQTLETDICIIGAGISGQIVASKIEKKKIILIDSGSVKYNANTQELNKFESSGHKFRANHINRMRQLGGSANLWANQLMFLEKLEIEDRDWIDKNLSWPIDYKELESNYKEGLENVFDNKIYDFYNQNKKKNDSKIFNESFFINNNISFKNHIWPSKVEKFDNKSKFTKKLLKKKNIFFLENSTLIKINIDNESQLIKNIELRSTDKTINIKSKIFVLACGAIENARIILNNLKNNKILENDNLGRYLMDHPRLNLGILNSKKKLPLSVFFGHKFSNFDFRKSISLSHSLQKEMKLLSSHVYIDPFFGEKNDELFEEFLNDLKGIIKLKSLPKFKFRGIGFRKLIEQIYFKLPPQVSSSILNNLIRLIISNKKYHLSFLNMKINYQGEQKPNYDSKITLSNKKDKFDQNISDIDWKFDKIDHDGYLEFTKIIKNIFKDNPNFTFEENINKEITDASHHSGTTRMSISKNDGVVDKNLKFHTLKNLFISGNSVFRTIGSGNPGLTNIALSNRLGKYINNL